MTLQADAPGDTLDPAFADYLLGVMTAALPAAADEQANLARSEAIRIAFRSLRPSNPMEAMLAAEVIAAHHVIMDCFRVALAPKTEPAAAARARSNAATLSRVRLATLRALEKQPAPATPRPAAPARPKAHAERRVEAPEPVEPVEEGWPTAPPLYNPRDPFGNPIERWRSDDMTMAQRRATYGEPKYVAVREEALAEEAAAIAAQSAPDAVAPDPGTDTPVTLPPTTPC